MGSYTQKQDPHALALAVVALALVLAGLVAVYSATSAGAVADGKIISDRACFQVLFALFGAAVGYCVYRFVPVSVWSGGVTWALWASAVALLVATALFGAEAGGAKRWLIVGPVRFQPSEFMKAAFVLMAAKVVEEQRRGDLTPRGMWFALVLRVGLPVVAMLHAQSDLGTTMVCLVGVVAALWLGGVPIRHVLALCAVCLVVGMVAVVTSPYRLERFAVTFDPWSDGQGGLGSGYQLVHSLYAISSGGVLGVGIGSSSEKYGSLPEAETDFIFAVIGEECGLVGTVGVIALFLAFLWAGMRISSRAEAPFGASLAGALTTALVFQAFLNIASVIGAFPMTGKPLPFVSYGGSSLVMSLVMAGIIASVTRELQPSERDYRRRRDDLVVIRRVDSRVGRGLYDGPRAAGRGGSGLSSRGVSTGGRARGAGASSARGLSGSGYGRCRGGGRTK